MLTFGFGRGKMKLYVKLFVVAFVLTFMGMVVLDLPPIKSYIQKQVDQAPYEVYKMRSRYRAARTSV